MTRDYEDIFNLDDMNDDELKTLVRDELAEYDTLDADNILVTVESGVVILAGRVGTDSERRVAEHVLTDVIGVRKMRNDLVVDAIRRGEEPEAVDDYLAAESARSGEPLGRGLQNVDDESEHLEEDLDAQLYGTHDLQSAIERGTPWNPPDTPTPEGMAGTDALPGEGGEDH